MEIKKLDQQSIARWDQFVETCPETTFFHKAGWKEVIERAFGHTIHFLYAEENGEVVGVLPLGHVKSFLFGNALISSPFCVYGGIAATSAEAREALDQAACELARELNVDYLEMRNRQEQKTERPRKALYVTFKKTLDTDVEANLQAIPRKQRAVVRKGIKSGMLSVVDDHVDRFYQAYGESVRNLGTPVFSKRYFQIIMEVFPDCCEVQTIEFEGKLVASVMSFYFRDEVLPYYGGGTSEARALKGNDFMYWELMRRATEKGVKIFDYGRSKEGTGSYRFKKHWGFEPEPLHYEFELINATEMPDINPMNPKYKIFIEMWQKLPLPISMMIGPWISKNLG
jgi:FemAB-related protein (PEP-CTERM system-associated)